MGTISSVFSRIAAEGHHGFRVLVIGGDAPASFPFETASVEKCSDTLPGCLAGGCSSIELANYKYTGKPVDVVYVRKGTEAQVHAWVRYACDVVKPAVAVMGDGYADANVRKAVFSALCGVDLSEGDLWAAGTEKMLNPPEHGGAIVWCTDGSDRDLYRLRLAVASFRAKMHDNCPFVVLVPAGVDMHDVDRSYGLRRIDPTPYLQACGLTTASTSKITTAALTYGALFRFVIPLVPELRKYTHVLYVDTDTYAVPESRFRIEDVFSYEFPDGCEMAAVVGSVNYLESYMRVHEKLYPDWIRPEMEDRVWGRYNYRVRPPVNSGVLLWNIPGFSRTWLLRRLRVITKLPEGGGVRDCDQGILNTLFSCDASLSPTYNSIYVGTTSYGDVACIRHYGSWHKGMLSAAVRRSGFLSSDIACAQYPAVPYADKAVVPGKTCAVWVCWPGCDRDVRKSLESFVRFRDEAHSDVQCIVLFPRGFLAAKDMLGALCVDCSGFYAMSGLVSMPNAKYQAWGTIDCGAWFPLLIPFVPELAEYGTVLYMTPAFDVHDAGFFSIFEHDVAGYDCAAVARFPNFYYTRSVGELPGHGDVGWCVQMTRELCSLKDYDANYIIGRLQAGIHYGTGLVLFNMAQTRTLLRSAQETVRLCQFFSDMGCPDSIGVADGVVSCMFRVSPLLGSYFAGCSTYTPGAKILGLCEPSRSTGGLPGARCDDKARRVLGIS